MNMQETPEKTPFRRLPRRLRFAGFSRGTTFVELLWAMVMMGILFTIGWAISNSILGVRKVRNHEIAVALAHQAIEAARAARFREIGSPKDGRKDTLVYDFNTLGQVFDGEACEGFIPLIKVGNVEFKREVSVTDAPSALDGVKSGLKLLRVIISWKAPEDGFPMVFEAVTGISE